MWRDPRRRAWSSRREARGAVCVSTAMFSMSVAALLRATHGRLGEVSDDAQMAVAFHEATR